jgi:helicase
VLFPVHKSSIQERQRWQNAMSQQRLPPSVMRELNSTGGLALTTRCKKFACVLMWIQGVELNRLEASLLQHLPADNAAGPIRSVAERTRDLIGVVARIGELVTAGDDPSPVVIDDLTIQLELGIPEDIAWLGRETKRALERGDYLALRRGHLSTFDALLAVDETTLRGVVDSQLKRSVIRKALTKIAASRKPPPVDLPMPAVPEG